MRRLKTLLWLLGQGIVPLIKEALVNWILFFGPTLVCVYWFQTYGEPVADWVLLPSLIWAFGGVVHVLTRVFMTSFKVNDYPGRTVDGQTWLERLVGNLAEALDEVADERDAEHEAQKAQEGALTEVDDA